jgi:hypothetical protein
MTQSLVDVMLGELPSILTALEAHGDIRKA